MTGASIAPRPVRHRTSVRLVGLVGVLVAAFILGLAPFSAADTGDDKKKLDTDIATLRTELEGTSRHLAGAFVALKHTRGQLPGARQQLRAADAAQRAADRRNEAVATALAVARANAAKAADTLARNARDSQKVQDQLVNMVRDDYQQGGFTGLAIALEAESPEDFTNRMVLMDTIMRVRTSALSGLDTMQAEGTAVRAHLVAVRQQVTVLKVQAESALARARAARAGAAAAKTKLDLLYAAQTRYAAAVAVRKANETTNLKEMQAESDTLTRVLSARARASRAAAARVAAARAAARASRQPGRQQPRSQQPPSQQRGSGGFLSFPVNAPVSSEFGPRYHPVLRYWRLHAGIDFAASCGAPVHAAAGGTVIMAATSGGYGNQLVIDHGTQNGVSMMTTYSHLSSFVATGGRVSRGQLVAYSGTTGLSTGCHLHFETREDGIPVNPRTWF